MRQGQQNRRGRGRNNNNNNNNNHSHNRKSQNPLTRSFESTGPDVKVRGTPAHVAEKYISLARDALSSGDRVLAENYLQHAEHYNRIILTYREQQVSQGGEFQGQLPRAQTFNAQDPMDGDEFGDEEGDELNNGGAQQPVDREAQAQGPNQNGGHQPRSYDGQPRYDNRQPRQDNRGEHRNNNQRHDRDGNRFDRGDRQDRGADRGHDRGERSFNRNDNRDRDRGERQERGDRNDRQPDRNQDRNQERPFDRNADRGAEPREFREDRPQPSYGEMAAPDVPVNGNGNGAGRPPRRERFSPANADRQPSFLPQAPSQTAAPAAAAPPPLEASEQPAFLRRPVRRPRRDDSEAAAPAPAPAVDETE